MKTLTGVLLLLVFLTNTLVQAQTTYYWVGGTTGSAWSTNANWNTTKGGGGTARTPATDDVLIVDGTNVGTGPAVGPFTITSVSTEMVGALQITGLAVVTLKSSGAQVLSFSASGAALQIDAGASLTIGGSGSGGITIQFAGSSAQSTSGSFTFGSGGTDGNLTINNSAGVTLGGDLSLAGTITLTAGTFTVGAHTLGLQQPIFGTATNLSADATSSISISGSASGIDIPSSVTALNNLTLNNSNGTTLQGNLTIIGKLTLSKGSITANGHTLSYGGSSTLVYSGNSAQTTSDVEFPSSSGPANVSVTNSQGVTLHAARTITGNFVVNGGKLVCGTNTIGGSGEFILCPIASTGDLANGSNQVTNVPSNSAIAVNMSISGTGIPNNSTIMNILGTTLTISSNATADGSSVALSIGSAGTLSTGNTAGVNGTVTCTASYGSGSSYELTGSSAQVTGALMPTTVNVLTIDNSSGVSLNNATIVNVLKLVSGSVSGAAFTYGSPGTLIYHGGAVSTTNTEWPASGGPTNVTISSSGAVTLHASRQVEGTLTMQSGSLSVGANALTYGASGSLTYSGSSSQTTSSDEFPTSNGPNSLMISNTAGVILHASRTIAGSVMLQSNLDISGTTLTLGTSTSTLGSISASGGYLVGSGTLKRWFAASSISGGQFPMGYSTNNRTLSLMGTPTAGGTVSVQHANATGTTSIAFSENSKSFVNRSNMSWTVSTADEFAANPAALSMSIQASGIGGVTSINDINISGATGAAGGVFSSPTGSPTNPLVNRSGMTEADLASTFYIASTSSSPLPVQMSKFTVTSKRLTAVLSWTTATEANCYGFEIERTLAARNAWEKIGFVRGAGTSNVAHDYTFTDKPAVPARYAYRVKQVDNDGTFEYYSPVESEVGIAAKALTLGQNYPNPFNPSTNIEFTLPQDGHALVRVFNTVGQVVATLFDGAAQAGRYYQVSFDASKLSSGVYYSRLDFNGNHIVKKLLLVK